MVKEKRTKHNKGYTLLFAVLTASLVLGVAAFVVGVARKQYIISATARDSMFSFYNADSAIGCVLQSLGGDMSTTTARTISCNGTTNASVSFVSPALSLPTGSSFQYGPVQAIGSVSFGTDGCAVYNIWVGYDDDTPPDTKMVVETRGYNVCNGAGTGPAISRRTVERAIRVTQQ